MNFLKTLILKKKIKIDVELKKKHKTIPIMALKGSQGQYNRTVHIFQSCRKVTTSICHQIWFKVNLYRATMSFSGMFYSTFVFCGHFLWPTYGYVYQMS